MSALSVVAGGHCSFVDKEDYKNRLNNLRQNLEIDIIQNILSFPTLERINS